MAPRNPLADAMRALRKPEALVPEGGTPAIVAAAETLRGTIEQKLNHPGSGKIRPSARGGLHQASAPGEPPAPDRGDLRGSTKAKKTGTRQARTSVGPHEAAEKLEFGSRGGGEGEATVLPRPYMRPSLEEAIGAMTDVLVDQLKANDASS